MKDKPRVIDMIGTDGHVLYVSESDTVRDVGRLMSISGAGSVLVKGEDGQVTGMVTSRDLVVKVIALDKEPSMVLVREIMAKNPTAVRSDVRMREAMKLMAVEDLSYLPVVEEINGRKEIIGIVSTGDVLSGSPAASEESSS